MFDDNIFDALFSGFSDGYKGKESKEDEEAIIKAVTVTDESTRCSPFSSKSLISRTRCW